MAASRSRLTTSQEEAVGAICKIGPEALERVLKRIEQEGLIINVDRIRQLIVSEVGEENGEQLAAFLFRMAVAYRTDESSPVSNLQNVSAIIAKRARATSDAWELCRPVLERLLVSQSLRAATKALSVSYDFERVYIEGRFLTSLRPIFDPPREEIIGAVIVQTLRLEYTTPEGGRATMSLALDKADLEQLLTSCKRAIQKADKTLEKASTTWALPTFIPGERLS